jgi:hypothetical protein
MLSPIATPVLTDVVFAQGYVTDNCTSNNALAYPTTCGTVPLASFDDSSSSGRYNTCEVSFDDPRVVLPDGAKDVFVVSQSTYWWYDVVAGTIIFPAAGTPTYTVTITDTQDGASASWTGSIPVGPPPTPTPSPSATPS